MELEWMKGMGPGWIGGDENQIRTKLSWEDGARWECADWARLDRGDSARLDIYIKARSMWICLDLWAGDKLDKEGV